MYFGTLSMHLFLKIHILGFKELLLAFAQLRMVNCKS